MPHASHMRFQYNIQWELFTDGERQQIVESIFNDGAASGRRKALAEVGQVIDDMIQQTPQGGTRRFAIMRPLRLSYCETSPPLEGPSWDTIELTRDHWAVVKYQLTGRS